MKNINTLTGRVALLATSAYVAMGAVMAHAQAEPSPIEQVFEALDIDGIIASVVTTGVAATGIFLAYRGILFAKKLIGRYL